MTHPVQRLFLGAFCIGFAPIFIKLIDLGPTAIGFYRCAIGSLMLLSLCFLKRESFRRVNYRDRSVQRALLFLGIAGTILGLDFTIWHRSIFLAGAGMATILANTQVFYVAIFGVIFLHEKITVRFVVGVLTAFLGIFLLVNFHGGDEHLSHYWLGILCGLGTGVCYAVYLISLRGAKKSTHELSSTQMFTLVTIIGAITLFCLSAALGELTLPSTTSLLWLFLLALVAQVIGWILITEALPKVPVSLAGLILLVQPVLATLMSAMFFQERLTSVQILGCILTLGAIYLGSTWKTQKDRA